MEWRKGFLSEQQPRKPKARKATALPDEAFLPAESYDLAEDEGDAVDPRIAELETSQEAHEYSVEYSRSHVSLYNQGISKLAPDVLLQFCEDLRVVAHNRKFFGHHDGAGKGGTSKSMLLPSGIVQHYLEWGAEAAPPIVLLHDICGCAHEFDELARPLADKYRVLVPDMRGHGETTHSPSHAYAIDELVKDLHELVVRLSLNGRDWGGAWTRPWVLLGKGTGGAVASAYVARHKGRVAGLTLWDYDPEWPKDRINFYPFQAAHFAGQGALAAFLNDQLALNEDAKYLSITYVNRAHAIDTREDAKGCVFNMDSRFFLSSFNAGVAWSQLREAASATKVLLLWSQNSREWSYSRMNELATALKGGEAKSVDLATVSRGTSIEKESGHAVEDFARLHVSCASHVRAFADRIDREARSALKAQGRVRYEKVSDEEVAQQRAEKESARMAAREAAEAMASEDKPIEISDDLLD